MTRVRALIMLLALGVAVGCQEELASPTECPELCPGLSLSIRDTLILANQDQDSSFTGYVGAEEMSALLISDGINAGEARAFATFPKRPDSVTVGGTTLPITVDSVAFSVQLLARDSTVGGLKLFLHRIAPGLDSTVTLAAVDAMLTPETLIDSVEISDTLERGTVRLVLPASKLDRLVGPAADSGRLGIGFRIKAPEPTGIRIGSLFSVSGGPLLIAYGKVAVTDTALQRQTLTVPADKANYVIEVPAVGGNDRLVVGGKLGTRSILRFTIPPAIRDSATIIRATLELTPAVPIRGLRNDPAALQVRGVLVDLGAKSPVLSNLSVTTPSKANETDVQQVEVLSIVSAWLGKNNFIPTVLLMGIAPEGGSFGRPEFFSSRSGTGAPGLRITYALPSRPGHP
jgi:hypothetical protein